MKYPCRSLLAVLFVIVASSSLSDATTRKQPRHFEAALLGSPFGVTYSEDGRKLALDPFLLDIFETDGDLTDVQLHLFQDVTNQFLTVALNERFMPNYEIGIVNTTVIEQSRTVLEGTSRRRDLSKRARIVQESAYGSLETAQDVDVYYLRQRKEAVGTIGSTLKVTLDVTFDRLPSPDATQTDEAVKSIMKDLSVLQGNISSFELFPSVFMIHRRELFTLSPSGIPTATPVATPTSPILSPTLSPIASTTPYPAGTPTTAPVDKPILSPTLNKPTITTLSPVGTPTTSPVSTPTTAPDRIPTTAPAGIPTTAPVGTTTKAPVDKPILSPIFDRPTDSTLSPLGTITISPVVTSSSPTLLPFVQPTKTPVVNPTSQTMSPVGTPTLSPAGSPTIQTLSPVSSPTTSPTGNVPSLPTSSNTDSILTPGDKDSTPSNSDSKIGIISGSIVGAAVLVLLAAFFVLHNRRQDDDGDESKDIFLHVNSDVESSMPSTSSSQKEHELTVTAATTASPSPAGSNGKSAADSIFSGLSDCEMESLCSPRHRSIMSKKSLSSQTTVQASGNGPSTTPTSQVATPTSLQMVGSLFAFEEVSLEDESSSSSSPNDSKLHEGNNLIQSPAATTTATTPLSTCHRNRQSTPRTDMAIVNGQTPVTPTSPYLHPKTPVTDAAVDMSLNMMEKADNGTTGTVVRELVFERSDAIEMALLQPEPLSTTAITTTATTTTTLQEHQHDAIDAIVDLFVPMATPQGTKKQSSAVVLPSPQRQKYQALLQMTPLLGWRKRMKKLSPREENDKDDDDDNHELVVVNEGEQQDQGAFPTLSPDHGTTATTANSRRHAGYDEGTGDGAAEYQNGAMHPLDWSNKGDSSVSDSTVSSHREALKARKFMFAHQQEQGQQQQQGKVLKEPSGDFVSPTSNMSTLSGHSHGSNASSSSSQVSASRQLIQDLVWLEQKIASEKAMSSGALSADPTSRSVIEAMDSLSYVSGDQVISPSSNEGSTTNNSSSNNPTNTTILQSIVCRDCFAPPGKLQIVLRSTKDGPSVHTVKPGSSLEGHLFPGDLIIAVDNVDTRTYTADAVMKMMATKHSCERKITVLHFDETV